MTVNSARGFLLSPLTLRLLYFSMNYSYFYRVMPYQWEQGAENISCHQPTLNPFGRQAVIHCFVLYALYLAVRVVFGIINFEISKFPIFILELFFLGVFTLMTTLQFSLFQRGSMFGRMINRFLHYYKQLQRKFPSPSGRNLIIFNFIAFYL